MGFGVFLITGLVPYLALNDVIMRSSRVIRANATLVQRVRLPLEVLVVGDILGTLMHHAIAVVLMILYCVWAGHLAVAGAGWVLVGIALLLVLAVGVRSAGERARCRPAGHPRSPRPGAPVRALRCAHHLSPESRQTGMAADADPGEPDHAARRRLSGGAARCGPARRSPASSI